MQLPKGPTSMATIIIVAGLPEAQNRITLPYSRAHTPLEYWCVYEHLHQHTLCEYAKMFFTSKFLVTNFFSNPTHKRRETGTGSKVGDY
jgi:hypothetical protein